MHQTVDNMLWTLLYSKPSQNRTQARDIVDQALVTPNHAMWVTVAITFGSMLGGIAFSCDTCLDLQQIATWQPIVQYHKQYVNDNIFSANRN